MPSVPHEMLVELLATSPQLLPPLLGDRLDAAARRHTLPGLRASDVLIQPTLSNASQLPVLFADLGLECSNRCGVEPEGSNPETLEPREIGLPDRRFRSVEGHAERPIRPKGEIEAARVAELLDERERTVAARLADGQAAVHQEETCIVAPTRVDRRDRPAEEVDAAEIRHQAPRSIRPPDRLIGRSRAGVSTGPTDQQACLLEGFTQGGAGKGERRAPAAAANELGVYLGMQRFGEARGPTVARIDPAARGDIDVRQESGLAVAPAEQDFGLAATLVKRALAQCEVPA